MEIKEAVAAYIVDKLTTMDVAHTNLMGDIVIVVKGVSLDSFKKQLQVNHNCRVNSSIAAKQDIEAYKSAEQEEIFRDLVQVESGAETGTQEMEAMKDFIQDLGRKYPVIRYEHDHLSISYHGNRELEVADPKFFDLLDKLIEHIIQNDGISGFSAQS